MKYIYTDKSLVVRKPLDLVNNGECHQVSFMQT